MSFTTGIAPIAKKSMEISLVKFALIVAQIMILKAAAAPNAKDKQTKTDR